MLTILLRVGDRVDSAGFSKALEPKLATVAATAGLAIGGRIVAAPGEAVVKAKIEAFSDDLCLSHMQQRRVDFQSAFAFDAGSGGEIRHSLERADIFFAAVRITAVVELVGAEKNIRRFNTLRQRERKRQKNRVASRHVGYGNSLCDCRFATSFGHRDFIGERGTADCSQIEPDHPVRLGVQKICNALGGVKLARMPLTVIEAHSVRLEALLFGDRRGGGGIDAAAQKNDSVGANHGHAYLIRVPAIG